MEVSQPVFYVYNTLRKEFLVRAQRVTSKRPYRLKPGDLYTRWSHAPCYAQRYSNPSAARRRAAQINRQLRMKVCVVMDEGEAKQRAAE